jgi:hypothetical protein
VRVREREQETGGGGGGGDAEEDDAYVLQRGCGEGGPRVRALRLLLQALLLSRSHLRSALSLSLSLTGSSSSVVSSVRLPFTESLAILQQFFS